MLIKPCPWCKVTPRLVIPVNDAGTWNAKISCEGYAPRTASNQGHRCAISPTTRIVGIRNTTKILFYPFVKKVGRLLWLWNEGNPMMSTHISPLDLSRIEGNFRDLKGDEKIDYWVNEVPL